MNGFRIYGIRFGVMVCIDLNGWLVLNKSSLQDEAPEQFNTIFSGRFGKVTLLCRTLSEY